MARPWKRATATGTAARRSRVSEEGRASFPPCAMPRRARDRLPSWSQPSRTDPLARTNMVATIPHRPPRSIRTGLKPTRTDPLARRQRLATTPRRPQPMFRGGLKPPPNDPHPSPGSLKPPFGDPRSTPERSRTTPAVPAGECGALFDRAKLDPRSLVGGRDHPGSTTTLGTDWLRPPGLDPSGRSRLLCNHLERPHACVSAQQALQTDA
jgi:hypothetical protein